MSPTRENHNNPRLAATQPKEALTEKMSKFGNILWHTELKGGIFLFSEI